MNIQDHYPKKFIAEAMDFRNNLRHYFSSCTTLIVSIFQLLSSFRSVWRKKIRSSKENLNFNVRASGRKSKHTCFSKASAKVLLFFELTKYF